MDCYTWINSIGLVLDIIGVLILFKFGLPPKVFRDGMIPRAYSPSPEEKEREYSKFKKHERWSYFGLSILILGFGLQLISNFLK